MNKNLVQLITTSWLFLVVLTITGCGGLLSVPDEFEKCGSSLGGTACPDGMVCVSKNCVWEEERCNPIELEGPCAPGPQEQSRVCVNGACQDTVRNCTESYPIGACSGTQVCYQGECRLPADDDVTACSSDNTAGYCPAGSLCFQGTCYPVAENELCSIDNLYGICTQGLRCFDGECILIPYNMRCSYANPNGFCDAWQTCEDGVCSNVTPPDTCSTENLTGRCESNQVCVIGVCRNLTDNPCSAENVDGFCREGYACNTGECVPITDKPCSNNELGYCNAGQVCDQQLCTDPECSSLFIYGWCGTGAMCQDGSCTEQPCSYEFPTGGCEVEQYCEAGICNEYECSAEHPQGACPIGEACINAVCQSVECSTTYPQGYCIDETKICVHEQGDPLFGTCVHACDDSNTDGWCANNNECYQGYCLPACASNIRCGQYLQCCNEGLVCVEGACQDPVGCVPNTKYCLENTTKYVKCSSDGRTYKVLMECGTTCHDDEEPYGCSCDSNSDCPLDAQCYLNRCLVDYCRPFTDTCSVDGHIALCNAYGTNYEIQRTCSGGCDDSLVSPRCQCGLQGDSDCLPEEHCLYNLCTVDVCEENQQFCVNDDVWLCNYNGSEENQLDTCPRGCIEEFGQSGCLCEDDWDCPGIQSCHVNVCVGNDTVCRLDPQDFSDVLPQIEIQWGGIARGDGELHILQKAFGSPFAEFSQAVMVPLVINLDDDNGDGLINENDFPEIIFQTFAEQGEYFYNGVLRAIHGGGQEKGMDYFAVCGDIYWSEPLCGDGICEQRENSDDCFTDCGLLCGNGSCDAATDDSMSDETVMSCPKDCLPYLPASVCGNGICDVKENWIQCPQDCSLDCGDQNCEDAETDTCFIDCHDSAADPVCGDTICNGMETIENCAVDCLVCPTGLDSPADLDPTASIAAGDLNADGVPEIVTIVHEDPFDYRYIRIYNNRGKQLLSYKDNYVTGVNPAVVIADLDNNAPAEIIVGNKVFALRIEDGIWSVDKYFAGFGSSGASFDDKFGPIVCVADLIGDEKPEIVAGDTLYRVPPSFTGTNLETIWLAAQDDSQYFTGTVATGSTPLVIQFDGVSWATDQWKDNYMLRVNSGYYQYYTREIVESSQSSVTIYPPFNTSVPAGTQVSIVAGRVGSNDEVFPSDQHYLGIVDDGSYRTRVYAKNLSPVWLPANVWTNGFSVHILNGLLAGEIRHVVSSGPTYLNVDPPFSSDPTDGTSFAIIGDLEGKHDGFCAIADILGSDGNPLSSTNPADGIPEIILVTGRNPGRIEILDSQTGSRLMHFKAPGADSHGGAPNIADFDADGYPEIGYADAFKYFVVDLQPTDDCETPPCNCPHWNNCADGSTEQVPADVNPVRDDDCTMNDWCSTTQDGSSRSTGSSVFDLNGDGAAEVIYNDECYFRVYSGKDGKILYRAVSSSRTSTEYPVIADVDNDGNAEILFSTSNESEFCGANGGDPLVDQWSNNGLEVWGDPSDAWVTARRIWHQHPYHITDITENGFIPQTEYSSWLYDNSYRRNSQGRVVGIPAPDLQLTEASLSSVAGACDQLQDDINIIVRIANTGELRVGPGVSVSLQGQWHDDGATEYLLDSNSDMLTLQLTNTLEAGASVYVSGNYHVGNNAGLDSLPDDILAYIDDPAMPGAHESECNEMNNIIMIPVVAGANVAELQVNAVYIDQTACAGCVGLPKADVSVINTGSVSAYFVKVRFYVGNPTQGGYAIHEEIINAIAPSETVLLEDIVLNGVGGSFAEFPLNVPVRIYVWVNPDGAVVECNDANNIDNYQEIGCYCGG